jgi:hypothetical protein
VEWWQIILVVMGSIVAGILVGILVSYLINRFLKERFVRKRKVDSLVEEQRQRFASLVEEQRHKIAPAAEEQRHEIASTVGEHRHKKDVISMVPLFSLWSITALAIGLIVGAGLGLAYWAMSPQLRIGWPPVMAADTSTPPLYKSTVDIRVINRGTSYVSLRDLKRWGEYYTAKMNSVPFLEFLSQKIAEEAPQYSHSVYDLPQLVRIRYDYKSEYPSIEIRATSNNDQEAFFLAGTTASALQEYLPTEEHDIQLQEHQDKLDEWKKVRASLLKAEEEVASLAPKDYAQNLELDPVYISLSAKIRALEVELDNRAQQLATFIAEGNTDDEYIDAVKAMERASNALSQAKSELSAMKAKAIVEVTPEQKLAYMSAKTKADKLRSQLETLTKSLASWSAEEDAKALGGIAFYATGEPSVPTVIPPEKPVRGRNAVMMGAVLGIGGAWLVLNRKWLANGMPSSAAAQEEEDEE